MLTMIVPAYVADRGVYEARWAWNGKTITIIYDPQSPSPETVRMVGEANVRLVEYRYTPVNQSAVEVWEFDVDGSLRVSISVGGGWSLPGTLDGKPCTWLVDGVLLMACIESLKSASRQHEIEVVRGVPNEPAPSTRSDFTLSTTEEELAIAGLSLRFVRAVWEVVQRHGRIKSPHIAKQLGVGARSQRLGKALSILVQERKVFMAGFDIYSSTPTNFKPCDDDVLVRVLQVVCDNPGVTTSQIAQAVNLHPSTVLNIVRYLTAEGFIVRRLAKTRRHSIPWLHYPADFGLAKADWNTNRR
jgi:hypothetical protein